MKFKQILIVLLNFIEKINSSTYYNYFFVTVVHKLI